jgi:hypothetical protein
MINSKYERAEPDSANQCFSDIKQKQTTIIDGCKVTINFNEKSNNKNIDAIKQMILANLAKAS